MKIAVIGSGGREHTMAWKLAQQNPDDQIFVLPGNGGTKNNVDIGVNDFPAIKQFCQNEGVELICVGPEDPLANGIVDFFIGSGIKVFGPDKEAAQLEGSKIFAKQFMKKYGVGTADFWMSDDPAAIDKAIYDRNGNIVIKFDGLAAGKGVYVCSNQQESRDAITDIRAKYGDDAPFIVEEKLTGLEVSIIGFTDGKDMKMLLPSQDHKPAYDGDKGPNTGGMGAFCPVPFCNDALLNQIKKTVVDPTLKGIQAEGMNYKGVIYFGLMMSEEGPKLLEYNVRFGDPETEVILPSLKTNMKDLVLSCLNGTLSQVNMEFFPGYFVDVVLASGGYPGSYKKGKSITGLDSIGEKALVFHAGTKMGHGTLVTCGGRVLNIVGKGESLQSAIDNAYREVKKVTFDKVFYRTDIAQKGLQS